MSAGKDSRTTPSNQPKWLTITGWVLTVLTALLFMMSAGFKFAVPLKINGYEAIEEGIKKQGFDVQTMTIIGFVEVACALIYLFPKTSILGAILLAGYLGGAIVVHLIAKELIVAQVIIGLLVWLGIFLREPRLRSILFWR